MSAIRISAGSVTLSAKLDDTPTAQRIADSLPIEGSANVWGDEIYFDIPVSSDLDTTAREEVEVGTIAYWPPGSALCLFFGKTPVSTSDKPRAYSPVNIVGMIAGDAAKLRGVKNGEVVKIEAAD